jgi:hypothetical protein
MKKFEYNNLTVEKLHKTIEEVFQETSYNHKGRQTKLYVYGTVEQMEKWIKDFDEYMKEEIRKQYGDM